MMRDINDNVKKKVIEVDDIKRHLQYMRVIDNPEEVGIAFLIFKKLRRVEPEQVTPELVEKIRKALNDCEVTNESIFDDDLEDEIVNLEYAVMSGKYIKKGVQ